MDTLSAFFRAKAAQGQKQKVFDWHKAADIIRDGKVQEASAGLSEDLEYTEGTILENGIPVSEDDTYCYLSSNWAIPVLVIEGEEIPCWKYEDELPEPWDSGTMWPESAKARLLSITPAVEDHQAIAKRLEELENAKAGLK